MSSSANGAGGPMVGGDTHNFYELWNDPDLLGSCEKLADIQPDFLIASDDEAGDIAPPPPSIPPALLCTPGKENQNSLISSPQFCTPYDSKSLRPFASCSESPIDLCTFAASTPFQGQRVLSNSSQCGEQLPKKMNMTYEAIATPAEKLPVIGNETFNTSSHPAGNGTFVKDCKNIPFCKGRSTTFDSKPEEKDSDSDIMESCSRLESSGDSNNEKPKRKPLSAIPQPKTTAAAKVGVKKISRLAAPRMNTAALSRIQARSPGGTATHNDAEMMKHPKKTAPRARKSLMPPSNVGKPTGSLKKSNETGNSTEVSNSHSEAVPTKRKAQESPKRAGRSPKVPGKRTTALQRPSAVNRSSSAPTSRVPSATALSSRLQRPSALKASSSTRLSTIPSAGKLPDCRASTIASRNRSNAGVQSSNAKGSTVATNALTAAGNLRKTKESKEEKKAKENGACITGLAILLDYVVNKLDGMSAPRILQENQKLQTSLCEKEETNKNLTIHLKDLEQNISSTIEKHSRECAEANQRHALELEEERMRSSQLESEGKACLQQIASLQRQEEALRTSHEEELVQLQEEWSSERQQMQDAMESRITEELEERIKPYVNAKSEVESLTAVLDLRNDTIRKLEAQSSSYDNQRDELLQLQYKVERLQQKNEDLAMQLQEKMEENRTIAAEYEKLQRSSNDEHNRSARLQRQNEELVYRLNSVSPTSSSPFNPVFTTSPSITEAPPFGRRGSSGSSAGVSRLAFVRSKPEDQTNENEGTGIGLNQSL